MEVVASKRTFSGWRGESDGLRAFSQAGETGEDEGKLVKTAGKAQLILRRHLLRSKCRRGRINCGCQLRPAPDTI